MELTKKQAAELISFLEEGEADRVIGDLNTILKFIDENTMSDVEFNLEGEQTDDIKEVYAYMMRKGLTKLDELKGLGKLKKTK